MRKLKVGDRYRLEVLGLGELLTVKYVNSGRFGVEFDNVKHTYMKDSEGLSWFPKNGFFHLCMSYEGKPSGVKPGSSWSVDRYAAQAMKRIDAYIDLHARASKSYLLAQCNKMEKNETARSNAQLVAHWQQSKNYENPTGFAAISNNINDLLQRL